MEYATSNYIEDSDFSCNKNSRMNITNLDEIETQLLKINSKFVF